MARGVYAGSFDPITNGHLWMVEQGARLFDDFVVAVGINPEKRYTFSLDDRLELLQRATRRIPNVRVGSFENQFLVHYAQSIGADCILRGVRSVKDHEYERDMRHVNSDVDPHILTIFVQPPRDLAEVSSSMVNGLVGPDRWEEVVERYVPRVVYNKLLVRRNGMQSRWSALMHRLGVHDGEQEYLALLQAYGDPSRSYHDMVHITHSLRELDAAAPHIKHPDIVELALWYHDAVYDTRRKDNEERSAQMGRTALESLKVSTAVVTGTVDLVAATKHTGIPTDSDAQHLMDIDLSILGKSEKEFNEYEAGIKEEYAWVPEGKGIAWRSAVLQGFLDRDFIYATDFFRERYEAQARKNLRRSLDRLAARRKAVTPIPSAS